MGEPVVLEPVVLRKRFRLRALVLELVVLLSFAFFFFLFVQSSVLKIYAVPSGSMSPTIEVGDRLVVGLGLWNGLVSDGGVVGRGDVVVFRDADGWMSEGEGGGEFLVKRIIGVGGDVVRSDGVEIWVNGELLVEPYVVGEQILFPFYVQVPEGRLFVLGDNRNFSFDSRSFLDNDARGTVALGDVVGRVRVLVRGWDFVPF